MVLSRQRIGLKNRIHATLAKYAIRVEEVSDIFGTRGLKLLEAKLPLLPPHNRYATEELLAQLEQVVAGIGRFEQRMREVFAPSEKLQLIETLPGVGFILAVVILVEVGDVERLARAEQLAAYAGTTPRVIASGGKMRFGLLRTDVNHYLKWAFVEAANSI
jgi:transposase